MSMISDVVKSKKKIKDLTTARNKEQVSRLRKSTAFRARLVAELNDIDKLFDTNEVSSVTVRVSESMIADFTEAMYSEDTAEFTITQVDGEPNLFIIQRGYVMFS